nr:hypothetical protein [uncultured Cohaesibacter sp.]
MRKVDVFTLWDYIREEISLAPLSNEEQAKLDLICTNIMWQRERVAKFAHTQCGDLLVWNPDGALPPLCWCFNDWSEAMLFSRKLSPQQPFYACHSMHAITVEWLAKMHFNDPLAKRYLDSMEGIIADKPVLFGGNCQGAPIAESMAQQQANRSGPMPFLITLDYIGRRSGVWPRLMLFGKQSRFNPFDNGHDPLPYWQERGKHFAWATLSVGHGQYFKEPNIDVMAGVITQMSGRMSRSEPLPQGPFELPALAG